MMATVQDYMALSKPRIVLLLLVTCYCAMVVANRGLPGAGLTALTLAGLSLTAGGANAVNMWYDRDIDPVMERTRTRPVAARRIRPERALAAGIAAGVAGSLVLALGVGVLACEIALAGYLFYVLVYTMWLKRRTPQNIVIGGAAGAFPPLVGWTAITHGVAVAPVLMFLIIFLWTPPHFWSLALYKNDDYVRAAVPMMPVVKGPRSTKVQSLVYGMLLLVSSVLLYLSHAVGRLYLGGALALGLLFVVVLGGSLIEPEGEVRWAKRSFRVSLLYLLGLFFFMWVNVRK